MNVMMTPPEPLLREAEEQTAENSALMSAYDEDGPTPLILAALESAKVRSENILARLKEFGEVEE
jgi:hypothetical protein